MHASILLLAALVGVLPLSAAGAAGTPDERAAAYREFRNAFDQGDYKSALPAADRVVQMTRSQFEADAPEIANALTNLATTYYRLRAHGDALDNYREAITLLELQNDSTDKRMVRPLHGLGSALLALRRADEAIGPLKRAVDIIRNRDGLHAEEQLPVLKTLIAAYTATDNRADAGREQEYAFAVAETAYGKEDQRLLVPLDELARWYERTGRYTPARLLYTRAVQIVETAKVDALLAIPALRGIARCFRLSYVHGESRDSLASAARTIGDPQTSGNVAGVVNAPSTDGERALLTALERLGSSPAQAGLRGAVHVDLGDWYLTASKSSRALESWRNAWQDLAAAGDTSPLDRPFAVVYIAPSVVVSQQQRDPAEYSTEPVNIRLAIDAGGNVRDATVANPTASREAAEKALIAALRQAHWRPAFRLGQPVATDDYLFRELVYVKRPGAKD
jgi:tetratricopeptide (TPR) repeat protein